MNKGKFSGLLESINISGQLLEEIAFDTGLIKRKRLIQASSLLYSICSEAATGLASFNDIAAQIESDYGISVSKQAIWKKATEPCVAFFKKVLGKSMLNKVDKKEIENLSGPFQYKRILLQDSTIIRLPIRLFDMFSGVANAHSKVCNARIQCIYDLIAEQFISFSIDPYSKNDLDAAPEIILQEGDLVLRDRGYLILNEIQRHIDNEAHCIFRYKNKMALLDPETKKPIDILAKLKKQKKGLDINVMLNNGAQTLIRLVAFPVNEEIANNRRRKARKEKKPHLQMSI